MLLKPRVICISKMDTVTQPDRDILDTLNFAHSGDYPIMQISAVSGEKLKILKNDVGSTKNHGKKNRIKKRPREDSNLRHQV